jgi:peptidoglycan/xylan/chitin deacetylase (PgdA/CDA1 family)
VTIDRWRAWARSGFLHAAGVLARPPSGAFLRCLYFHHVYDGQGPRFRALLERLANLGTFVAGERVRRAIVGKEPIADRLFHLSIDDGLDSVHRNAFPVLRALGIPATIFVPTALVGASHDRLRASEWIPEARPMDWDQIRAMRDAGFEIGTHTRHHVRLSDISHDAQRLDDEISGAKHDLEVALGEPCRYMSWPFGLHDDMDDAGLRAIERAGYELCFSAVRGRIESGRTSPFALPRHHFEPEWPWLHVRYFALGGSEPGRASSAATGSPVARHGETGQ